MTHRVLQLWIGWFYVQSLILVTFSDSIYFQYAFMHLVMFSFISHPYVAVGNMHVCIIRNFIWLLRAQGQIRDIRGNALKEEAFRILTCLLSDYHCFDLSPL